MPLFGHSGSLCAAYYICTEGSDASVPFRSERPGARWVYQKKSASEKMSVPILSKDPQGQEKIRYFR